MLISTILSSSLTLDAICSSAATRLAVADGGGGGTVVRGLTGGGGRLLGRGGGGGGPWKSGLGTKVDVGADPALALAVARRSLVHCALVCWPVRW